MVHGMVLYPPTYSHDESVVSKAPHSTGSSLIFLCPTQVPSSTRPYHSSITFAYSTRHGTTRLLAYEWCSTSLDLHCASRPTPQKSSYGATVCRRPDQPDRSGLSVALDHHPRPYLLFWPSTWSAGSYWDVSARQPGGRSTALVTFVTDPGKEAFHYDRRSNSIVKGETVGGMTDIRPKAFSSEEDSCQPWYHYYDMMAIFSRSVCLTTNERCI